MKVCCGMNKPFGECEGWCYNEMAVAGPDEEQADLVFSDGDFVFVALVGGAIMAAIVWVVM